VVFLLAVGSSEQFIDSFWVWIAQTSPYPRVVLTEADVQSHRQLAKKHSHRAFRRPRSYAFGAEPLPVMMIGVFGKEVAAQGANLSGHPLPGFGRTLAAHRVPVLRTMVARVAKLGPLGRDISIE
jgi:hypothetical protein